MEKFLNEDYHSENLKLICELGIGGVFYLFVRGLSAKNLKLGVFFDEMNYMLKSNNKKKNE